MSNPADNTVPCPRCGLQPQVRGCEPGACRSSPHTATVVLQGWPYGDDVADFDDQGNLRLFARPHDGPPAEGAWVSAHVVEKLRVVLNERAVASAPTIAAELEEAVGLLREVQEWSAREMRTACDDVKLDAFLARHPPKET